MFSGTFTLLSPEASSSIMAFDSLVARRKQQKNLHMSTQHGSTAVKKEHIAKNLVQITTFSHHPTYTKNTIRKDWR
jgi:hypothetical protein